MKKTILMILLLSLVFTTGCSGDFRITPEASASQVASPIKISAETAKGMMEKNDEIILVDVRSQEENNEENIEGSRLLPDDQILEKAEEMFPDKEATYIIHCQSGKRSATASLDLISMGYSHIYDMGGIADWPYETTKSETNKADNTGCQA